jgi:hypothetical protein
MFNEASALFRVELNRTPPEDRKLVVNEFLSTIAGFSSKGGGDYMEAFIRLQWANTCAMLQNLLLAEEELTMSEIAFNRLCDHFELDNRKAMPHMQALEYEKLSYTQNPFEKLQRTEGLASTLEKVESTMTHLCLSDAAELAIAIYKITSIQEYQNNSFDLRSRLEKYDETAISEDLRDLVMHHNVFMSVTLNSSVDEQKSLE